MRTKAGLTLVELLIAGMILVVLLSLLAGTMRTTGRAYRATQTITETSGRLRSVIQALQYDLSMAGFKGFGDGISERAIEIPVSFTWGSAGTEEDGRSIAGLVTTYYETRFTESGDLQKHVVSYQIEDGEIRRRINGQTDWRTLAHGIEGLQLIAYERSSGRSLSANQPPPDDLVGFRLNILYWQDNELLSERFSVTRKNL